MTARRQRPESQATRFARHAHRVANGVPALDQTARLYRRRAGYCTAGRRLLADRPGRLWMIGPAVRGEEFLVWTLTVAADRTALAIAGDGNGHELARQEIEYTDFPLEEITLYLTEGTLMLPSEY